MHSSAMSQSDCDISWDIFSVIASLTTDAAGDLRKKPRAPRKKSPFRHREARQRRGDLTFVSPKDKIPTSLRSSE